MICGYHCPALQKSQHIINQFIFFKDISYPNLTLQNPFNYVDYFKMWIKVKKVSDDFWDAEFFNSDNWTKMEGLLPTFLYRQTTFLFLNSSNFNSFCSFAIKYREMIFHLIYKRIFLEENG